MELTGLGSYPLDFSATAGSAADIGNFVNYEMDYVNLPAGSSTIYLHMITGNLNVNYIDVTSSSNLSNTLPVAIAAPHDREANQNDFVPLVGSDSYDPDNSPQALTFSWTQCTGPVTVQINEANTAYANFIAPKVAGRYLFRLTVSDGQATSSSYTDVWVKSTIPGRIEAENYDIGGEGVGYHVPSKGIISKWYRIDYVGMDHPNIDNIDQYVVCNTQAGEWLNYSVKVTTSGYYNIAAHVASDDIQSKSFQVTGLAASTLSFTIPASANPNTWTYVYNNNVYLTAGVHTVQIKMTTGKTSIDYLDVMPIVSIPGRIEAENYNSGGEGVGYHDSDPANWGGQYRADGVDISLADGLDPSKGYRVGWTAAGEWLQYNVTVPSTGTYTMVAHVASGVVGAKSFVLTGFGRASFPFTFTFADGFNVWKDVAVKSIPLSAGNYTLRLTENSDGFDIDYIDIIPSLAPPANLAATAVSENEVNLTWSTAETRQTGFLVERSADGGATYQQIAVIPNASTMSYYDNAGLSANGTYLYRVSTYNNVDTAPCVNVATVKTLATPAAPSNLTASAVSPTQINLSWKNNSASATNVFIEKSTDGITFSAVSSVGPAVTTCSVTGLVGETDYYFRVYAKNASGNSLYSAAAYCRTLVPPPSNFAATAVSSTEIDLSWKNNTTVDSYVGIERADAGSTTFHSLAQTSVVNATSYKDVGLTPGTSYNYRIYAIPQYELDNNSGYSTTANASTITCTITATAGANGSISPSGAVSVLKGGAQSFTIAPNANYVVDAVTVDGVSVGAPANYLFFNVTAGHTIAATFKAAPVSTKYTIVGSTCGAQQTGNEAVKSYDGSTTTRYSNDNTLANAWIKYDLGSAKSINKVRVMWYAGATRTYPIKIEVGTATLTQVWSGTTTTSSGYLEQSFPATSGQYVKITMTANNSAGSAWFSIFETEIWGDGTTPTNYTLATAASPAAGGTVTGGSSYASGTVATVTATPATGYSFTGWSGDLTGTTNPTTITMSANKSVTANFAIKTFTITASAGANGSIGPSGTTTVNYGASQTYTFAPATGYVVDIVTVDGVSQGSVTSYPFTNVTANHTISVSFKLATTTYALTTAANPVAGGSVSGGGSYAPGTKVTVTATPTTGYSFTGWSGGLTGSTNPTTITLSANTSVTATFSLKTFTITASAGANGTISPSGTATVNYGAGQTYSFTPTMGYVVDVVTVDGVSQGSITSYPFTNVTANHTISVTFKAAPVTNLALSKAATASSFQAGNEVAKANDADPTFTTRWAASSGTLPQWWKVDLCSSEGTRVTKNVNSFTVNWYKFSANYTYTVEVSTDNATWTKAGDFVDATTATNKTFTHAISPAKPAQYVRITITAVSSGWASMYDFEVMGQ